MPCKWLIACLFVLFAEFVTIGCSDSESGSNLTSDHEGWKQPGCWGCHEREETHNSNLLPYECTRCHGTNGAPNGYECSTPCGSCHNNQHGNDGFPDPDSCEACHD